MSMRPRALRSRVKVQLGRQFGLQTLEGGGLAPTAAGQLDADLAVDAPGMSAHHQHAVGERDRLLEVVRDEHESAPLRLPQLDQVILKLGAREGVERAEG